MVRKIRKHRCIDNNIDVSPPLNPYLVVTMKETPLSTCERNFVTQAIKQNQRLDGRKNEEFRDVKINFGSDWGSVLVALGETKVLAQVSCELGMPKSTRPNEGMMYINVELGPMAAPYLEANRNSELNVQVSRTLERTFKDSRCVDLESLCVTSEERVWVLRVDLNVLNHEGNLIDCCSIAALCGLAHFKRPDVSVVDNDVHIHTAAEKEPIPMVLHHYPVCVSYCTFDEGRIAVADPSAMEERTADSLMVFGLNSFRELCCLNLGGTTLTSSLLLLQCVKRAARRAKFVVDYVKAALEGDRLSRESNQDVGFTECLRLNRITALAEDRLALRLRHFSFKNIHEPPVTAEMVPSHAMGSSLDDKSNDSTVVTVDSHTAIMQSNQANIRWVPDDDDEEEDDNVVNMESDNASAGDDDDENSLSHNVEVALRQANKELNRSSNPRLLGIKNPQLDDGSDSEEEASVLI